MLTARDMQLINICDLYGVMTTNQIKSLLFKETDKRTMLRRLRELEGHNIVERFEGLPKGKLAWTLAWRGRSLSKRALPVRLTRNSLEHDCFVTAIRMALDKIHLGLKWRSHFDLRSEITAKSTETQIPDAIFTLPDDIKVALEVELTLKSKARYQKIASTYYFKDDIKTVWYVIQNERQLTTLKKIMDEKFEKLKRPNFVFSIARDILVNGENAQIFSRGGYHAINDFWKLDDI